MKDQPTKKANVETGDESKINLSELQVSSETDQKWNAARYISEYLQLIAEGKCADLEYLKPIEKLGCSDFQLMAAVYIYGETSSLIALFIQSISCASSDINDDEFIGNIISDYREVVFEKINSGEYPAKFH